MKEVKLWFLVSWYEIIIWLYNKRWFRRWMGSSWFHVCDIDTGEEFWTQETPNVWLVVVLNEEHWS